MKNVIGSMVIAATALYSAAALSGASADESALAICGKGIQDKLGVSHYTTFDKEVGILRQADGTKQYLINATYKSPDMEEVKHYRSVCEGSGYKASLAVVVEGAWSFTKEVSLADQVASINY